MSQRPEFTAFVASEPTDVLARRYVTEESALATSYLMQLRGNRSMALDEPLEIGCSHEGVAFGLVSRTVADARIAVHRPASQQQLYDLDLQAGTEQPIVTWNMETDGVGVDSTYPGGDVAQDVAYLRTVSTVLRQLCEIDFDNLHQG